MDPRTKNELVWPYIQATAARIKLYRRGAVVTFPSSVIPDEEAEPYERTRGVVRDQSNASRRRNAHAFGNANCTWIAMLCLTWQDMPPPQAVKEAWRDFRDWWRGEFGETPEAWVMEMQARGAPHFHLFIARESAVGKLIVAALEAGAFEDVPKGSARGGKRDRRLIRTRWVEKLGKAWVDCSLQSYSPDALWWHTERGIVEIVDNVDAAGRYVAKECSKREQKALPLHYAQGLGRWWYLAKRFRPEHWAEVDAGDLQASWPWDFPVKYVWDSKAIAKTFTAFTMIPENAARVFGADPLKLEAAAAIASQWPAARSQEKAPHATRLELQAQRAGWQREDMAQKEVCDSVNDDDTVCRGWRKFDSALRAFVCPECGTLRLASAAECERLLACK